MKKLVENDLEQIEKLHSIYSKEVPNFIKEILNTKEMKRLKDIGQNCGRDYISSKLQTFSYNYSRLTHSIGVGLIVWNFSKNKKQAIAGLLHDIATPTFAHVIDYYNNDAEKQTSTEMSTKEIIFKSKEIGEILKKYDINMEDVYDYAMYPIADNDMPQLSADRLEYNFYMGTSRGIITMQEAKELYEDIIIEKNESGIDEMCFQNIEMAKKMAYVALSNGKYMSGGVSTITNNLLSEILKTAVMEKILSPEMFMNQTEEDIVKILDNNEKNDLKKKWNKLKTFETIYETDEKLENKYSIKSVGKKRYIEPLVKQDNKLYRITALDKELEMEISSFAKLKDKYYSI